MATKRLTKAQQAKRDLEIDAQREAILAAHERWYQQAHGKEFTARVTAWDLLRGEGLVYIPDLNATFEIYACNLPGRKTWYPETACAFYIQGETVQVKLDIHVGRTFVLGVSPAYIDNVKWDSLDQTKLAFVCRDDGTTTGLFAEGGSL